MNFPQRTRNRIPQYDYNQCGAYFVTICTQNRRRLLSNIVGDGFPVPTPVGMIAENMILLLPSKYPTIAVDRFVIMPDHIHLLLRIVQSPGTGNPSPTLGNMIGWYKYQVTKQFHLLPQTQDIQLFQRSYYDHVIRNQQDYDEIWQYIESNPAKWVLKHRSAQEGIR